MRILVLGGSRFVGKHVVATALARGHEVTTFNRGITPNDAPADVERLVGDRDGGLDALRGRSFDAVVDTAGYVPRIVRQSAELLADRCGFYAFVSSMSVYTGLGADGRVGEDAPLATIDDPLREDFDSDAYGALKLLCENVVTDVFDERAHNARLSLVVGPDDYTDRFTYWPERFARGGDVLVFDHAERPIVRFVDVRDAAEFLVTACEARHGGTYNVGRGPTTIGDVVAACREVADRPCTPVYADEAFLEAQQVGAWMELPLWVPRADEVFAYLDTRKAERAGLTTRPLVDTVRAVLAWCATRPTHERGAGLAPERERELLARLAAAPESHAAGL